MTARRSVPASGVGMVALAAALWGTDALFRRGLALQAASVWVVFWEHLLLAGLTSPILWRYRRVLAGLDRRDWLSIVLIGAGASTTATIAFTAALGAGDPTTPLLLQKVQPIVAVGAAAVLLGERVSSRFSLVAIPALLGVFLVTFPSPAQVSVEVAWPAVLALTAAALWALGTVLGRRLSPRVPFSLLTALRFAVGLPVAAVLLMVLNTGPVLPTSDQLAPLVLLSLVPGLAALTLYYRGLRTTPASLATLGELAFPLAAVTINRVAFGTMLTTTQWVGVVTLATSVVALQAFANCGSRAVGVSIAQPLPPVLTAQQS